MFWRRDSVRAPGKPLSGAFVLPDAVMEHAMRAPRRDPATSNSVSTMYGVRQPLHDNHLARRERENDDEGPYAPPSPGETCVGTGRSLGPRLQSPHLLCQFDDDADCIYESLSDGEHSNGDDYDYYNSGGNGGDGDDRDYDDGYRDGHGAYGVQEDENQRDGRRGDVDWALASESSQAGGKWVARSMAAERMPPTAARMLRRHHSADGPARVDPQGVLVEEHEPALDIDPRDNHTSLRRRYATLLTGLDAGEASSRGVSRLLESFDARPQAARHVPAALPTGARGRTARRLSAPPHTRVICYDWQTCAAAALDAIYADAPYGLAHLSHASSVNLDAPLCASRLDRAGRLSVRLDIDASGDALKHDDSDSDVYDSDDDHDDGYSDGTDLSVRETRWTRFVAPDGYTPLMIAVVAGSARVVEALLIGARVRLWPSLDWLVGAAAERAGSIMRASPLVAGALGDGPRHETPHAVALRPYDAPRIVQALAARARSLGDDVASRNAQSCSVGSPFTVLRHRALTLVACGASPDAALDVFRGCAEQLHGVGYTPDDDAYIIPDVVRVREQTAASELDMDIHAKADEGALARCGASLRPPLRIDLANGAVANDDSLSFLSLSSLPSCLVDLCRKLVGRGQHDFRSRDPMPDPIHTAHGADHTYFAYDGTMPERYDTRSDKSANRERSSGAHAGVGFDDDVYDYAGGERQYARWMCASEAPPTPSSAPSSAVIGLACRDLANESEREAAWNAYMCARQPRLRNGDRLAARAAALLLGITRLYRAYAALPRGRDAADSRTHAKNLWSTRAATLMRALVADDAADVMRALVGPQQGVRVSKDNDIAGAPLCALTLARRCGACWIAVSQDDRKNDVRDSSARGVRVAQRENGQWPSAPTLARHGFCYGSGHTLVDIQAQLAHSPLTDDMPAASVAIVLGSLNALGGLARARQAPRHHADDFWHRGSPAQSTPQLICLAVSHLFARVSVMYCERAACDTLVSTTSTRKSPATTRDTIALLMDWWMWHREAADAHDIFGSTAGTAGGLDSPLVLLVDATERAHASGLLVPAIDAYGDAAWAEPLRLLFAAGCTPAMRARSVTPARDRHSADHSIQTALQYVEARSRRASRAFASARIASGLTTSESIEDLGALAHVLRGVHVACLETSA